MILACHASVKNEKPTKRLSKYLGKKVPWPHMNDVACPMFLGK